MSIPGAGPKIRYRGPSASEGILGLAERKSKNGLKTIAKNEDSGVFSYGFGDGWF